MIQLSRRELLAGTAATSASLLFGLAPSAVRAAQPLAGKQAPAFYRYKVGDYEVTQIADGARTFPMPDTFVVNQKKDDALAAADASYMPKGQVTIVFNPMVINTGSKLVLVDTGNGLGAHAATKGAVGQLNANMLAAGIDPKNIDIVLISHFHGDHIGGLKNPDGSLLYPNAEVKVPSVEQKFWSDDSNASKANAFNKPLFPTVKKAFEGVKFTEYDWDKEVAPGITAVGTPGHTPGHTSFVVSSGNGKLLVQSDVTNISMFVTHPDWHIVFDNDPVLAQATRHKFFDMASAEKLPVAGYHFTFPSLGHIEKASDGYRLVPAAWNTAI